MAKICAIKLMITGEPSDSQHAETPGGQTSMPAVHEGPVLALASEHVSGRSKKRPRWTSTKQRWADEDSTEQPFADQGDQTEQPLAE
ncbi:hypothetical protein CsSME_00014717 [Camellia sinensis var. sinensis]